MAACAFADLLNAAYILDIQEQMGDIKPKAPPPNLPMETHDHKDLMDCQPDDSETDEDFPLEHVTVMECGFNTTPSPPSSITTNQILPVCPLTNHLAQPPFTPFNDVHPPRMIPNRTHSEEPLLTNHSPYPPHLLSNEINHTHTFPPTQSKKRIKMKIKPVRKLSETSTTSTSLSSFSPTIPSTSAYTITTTTTPTTTTAAAGTAANLDKSTKRRNTSNTTTTDRSKKTFVTKRRREIHNIYEKNRRATLRSALERLHKVIPALSGTIRPSTLDILQHAEDHIAFLVSTRGSRNKVLVEEKIKREALLAKIERLK